MSSLFEIHWADVPDHVYRGWALKLQQELIDLLPGDYDVTLTDLFRSSGMYDYGKSAIRIKHSSFKGVLIHDEVLIFPRSHSSTLLYTHISDFQRSISYDNVEMLAKDLQKNLLKNTI